MFMLALALLAVWWPFHAKKHVLPQSQPLTIEQQDEQTAYGRCDKEGDLWFFLGSDNEIGFSGVSCGKAYRTWINTRIVRIKMSRV
jgi:hypothetical protein